MFASVCVKKIPCVGLKKVAASPLVRLFSTKLQTKQQFVWNDPLGIEDQLTEEEKMIQDSARAYCQEKLKPRSK